MCGRFDIQLPAAKLGTIYGADIADIADFAPRYNVAPTQLVPILFGDSDNRKFQLARFGLMPSWWKQKNRQLINLRRETFAEKPFFSRQLASSRCVLPVTGFFEWQPQADGPKIPYRFAPRNAELFSLGCVWETDKIDGQPTQAFAIITTSPNELMKPIHDRMPLILPERHLNAWLNPKTALDEIFDIMKPHGQARGLLRRRMNVFPANEMVRHKVSTAVNSPANDTADVTKPIN